MHCACFLQHCFCVQEFITCLSIDFFTSKIIFSFYRTCPPDSTVIIAASLDPIKAGLKEIYTLSLIIEFSYGKLKQKSFFHSVYALFALASRRKERPRERQRKWPFVCCSFRSGEGGGEIFLPFTSSFLLSCSIKRVQSTT